MSDSHRVESSVRRFYTTLNGPENVVPKKRYAIYSKQVTLPLAKAEKGKEEATSSFENVVTRSILLSNDALQDFKTYRIGDGTKGNNFGSTIVNFYLIEDKLFVEYRNMDKATSGLGVELTLFVSFGKAGEEATGDTEKDKLKLTELEQKLLAVVRLPSRSIARVDQLGTINTPDNHYSYGRDAASPRTMSLHVIMTGTFAIVDFTLAPPFPVPEDDILIRCRTDQVHMSRSLISACSPVLREQFEREPENNEFELTPSPELTPSVFYNVFGLMIDPDDTILVTNIENVTHICTLLQFEIGLRACAKKVHEYKYLKKFKTKIHHTRRDSERSIIHGKDVDLNRWSLRHGVDHAFIRELSSTTCSGDVTGLVAEDGWSDRMLSLFLERAIECTDHTPAAPSPTSTSSTYKGMALPPSMAMVMGMIANNYDVDDDDDYGPYHDMYDDHDDQDDMSPDDYDPQDLDVDDYYPEYD